MICYNCPNWQPFNPSTVNGFCSICGAPTRADTECFDPISEESEENTDAPLLYLL